jgi:hypothetical protein
MTVNERMCERCKAATAVRNEKYCKACRKTVLAELKESGYLTACPVGRWSGSGRGPEAREDVRETKFGGDY